MKLKLRDRAGASIALALFYLLICSVLSIVVITAGSVAAKSKENEAKNEQGYYITMSCFKLFQDELSEKEITYNGNLSLGEFEIELKNRGLNLTSEMFARGITEIKNETSEIKSSYNEEFSLYLEKNDCKVIGECSLSSFDYESSFEVKEIYIDGEKKELPSITKIIFGVLDMEEGDNYAKITYSSGKIR